MTSELAKNFIKNHSIKNFQELNELMREFYYSRGENKTNLTKEYGSEDLTAFNWMQKKYIKGSVGKLKSLFLEVSTMPISGITDIKNTLGDIASSKVFNEEVIRQLKGFNSTRHKANPNNTNYHHVNSSDEGTPLKETIKVSYSDTAGNKYEQNSTSVPEFKTVNDIFVTYFTPAEEDIIKEQDICNEDIYRVLTGEFEPKDFKFNNQTRMASDISPDTELMIESFKKQRNDILTSRNKESKIAGKKESEGKLFYEFDWNFIEDCAKRMQANKGKYERFNWKKSMDVEELKQSLFRHVIEIMKGNYKDGDDDYGHIYAGFCNLMLINWQLKNIDKNENSKNK